MMHCCGMVRIQRKQVLMMPEHPTLTPYRANNFKKRPFQFLFFGFFFFFFECPSFQLNCECLWEKFCHSGWSQNKVPYERRSRAATVVHVWGGGSLVPWTTTNTTTTSSVTALPAAKNKDTQTCSIQFLSDFGPGVPV